MSSTDLSAGSTSADRDLTIEVVNDPPEILGLSLNTNGQFVKFRRSLWTRICSRSGYQVRVDDKIVRRTMSRIKSVDSEFGHWT